MKVKLKDLIKSSQALMLLSQIDLPVLTSHEISKVIVKVRKELEAYDEVRIKLIKQYGVEDEVTKQFDILKASEENQKVFYDDINTLIEKEIDLNVDAISIDKLKSEKQETLIKSNILADLDFLIK